MIRCKYTKSGLYQLHLHADALACHEIHGGMAVPSSFLPSGLGTFVALNKSDKVEQAAAQASQSLRNVP